MSWISDANYLEDVAYHYRELADKATNIKEKGRLLRLAAEYEEEAELIRCDGERQERDD